MRKLKKTPALDTLPPEVLDAVRDLPALVPVEQAADFLSVHQRTLRRWARSGKIRTMRTTPTGAGKVRILRSELARVLAGMIQPVPFRP